SRSRSSRPKFSSNYARAAAPPPEDRIAAYARWRRSIGVEQLDLAGAYGLEALGRPAALGEVGGETLRWLVDGLVGEPEGSPMMSERAAGPTQRERLGCFFRVHVIVAHDGTRFVGADRQQRQGQRGMALAHAAETVAVAITAIADAIDL